MRKAAFSLSLRARMLVGGVAVNVMMLALLIVNGISIMDDRLNEQARIHLEEQKQLLNAALSVPLAAKEYRALGETLERVRRDNGIAYLLLFDDTERLVASAGWDKASPPSVVQTVGQKPAGAQPGHLFSEVSIEANGRRIGLLQFGLSTGFMRAARAELIRDSMLIGGIALVLSILSMVALSFWLTRSLA